MQNFRMWTVKNLILLSLLFLGSVIRFYGLKDLGIAPEPEDSFFYWETAYDWLNGNFRITEVEHFRPFIYWLQSLSLNVFGINDWALKFSNALFDLLNACILVFTAWTLRKNITLCLAPAVTYLFLGEIFSAARSEIVHTPSTTFVLLTFYFLISWLRRQRAIYLFLSGICLSVAWHIHPDLAVLGASVMFVIGWKCNTSIYFSNKKFDHFLKYFLIFLLGYFALFFFFSFKFGTFELINNLLANHHTQSKSLPNSLVWRLVDISFNYFYQNLGIVLGIAFILSLVFMAADFLKKKVTSTDIAFLSFLFFYLFFCSLLFSRYMLPRLFLPLIPLAILFLNLKFFDYTKHYRELIVFVLALAGVAAHSSNLIHKLNQGTSIYRNIERELKPFLLHSKAYLITPLIISNIHTPLSKHLYLDGKGIYLIKTNEMTLGDVLYKRQIKHVWISYVLHDARIMREFLKFSTVERLVNLFSMTPQSYDVQTEIQKTRAFLSKKGGVLLYRSKLGELYELK